MDVTMAINASVGKVFESRTEPSLLRVTLSIKLRICLVSDKIYANCEIISDVGMRVLELFWGNWQKWH
jgi:hypothetical protein